ncbi:MAG TPA: gliding motility-associated ABC transporter permease subunit GldF [Williamwhitmania sp.]|nr:gliding motility-associated ABC transporter permease subunit GldF [Williamwhitmania sp.]
MYHIFLKEIRLFFSSLTGYIAILVFLVANGLFMWVFPGEMNVLDAGYANIDTLFMLAPWVFLFLVPAITMRTFAEERKGGTLELLLTKPLTELDLVMGKFFASVFLVICSLVPTLIFFFSVYKLGNPVGNIDLGGTWGSFIGLFFLASIYVAIGVFASSLTTNQIVSFIVAMLLSFLLYMGFEYIGSLQAFRGIETNIVALGINDHYQSISRGVVDSRDILYFLSVDSLFLYASKLILQRRK